MNAIMQDRKRMRNEERIIQSIIFSEIVTTIVRTAIVPISTMITGFIVLANPIMITTRHENICSPPRIECITMSSDNRKSKTAEDKQARDNKTRNSKYIIYDSFTFILVSVQNWTKSNTGMLVILGSGGLFSSVCSIFRRRLFSSINCNIYFCAAGVLCAANRCKYDIIPHESPFIRQLARKRICSM